MKPLRLTLALSLIALLGTGLALPNAASAHDRHSNDRVERHHQDHHGEQQKHRRHKPGNSWYLMRHREVRPYGYRAPQRLYRMHGKQHRNRHHQNHYPHRPHHQQRSYSPVHLEIGYEIVL